MPRLIGSYSANTAGPYRLQTIPEDKGQPVLLLPNRPQLPIVLLPLTHHSGTVRVIALIGGCH